MEYSFSPANVLFKQRSGEDYFISESGDNFYRRVTSVAVYTSSDNGAAGAVRIKIQDPDLIWGSYFPVKDGDIPGTLIVYLGNSDNPRLVFRGRMKHPPTPDYGADGVVTLSFVFFGPYAEKKYDLPVPRTWPFISQNTKVTETITLYEVFEQISNRNFWLFEPDSAAKKLLKYVTYSALYPLCQRAEQSDFALVRDTAALWNLHAHLKHGSQVDSKMTLAVWSYVKEPITVSSASQLSDPVTNVLMYMNNTLMNAGVNPVGTYAVSKFEYGAMSISTGPDGVFVSINDEDKSNSASGSVTNTINVDHIFVVERTADNKSKMDLVSAGYSNLVRSVSAMSWKKMTDKDKEKYRSMVRTIRNNWFLHAKEVVDAFSGLKLKSGSLSPADAIGYLFGREAKSADELSFDAIYGAKVASPGPISDPLNIEAAAFNRGGDCYQLEISLTCVGNEYIDEGQWGMLFGLSTWAESYMFHICAVTHNAWSREFTTSVTLRLYGVQEKISL